MVSFFYVHRGLLENFHMVLTLDIGQRSQLNYWSIIVFPDPESPGWDLGWGCDGYRDCGLNKKNSGK